MYRFVVAACIMLLAACGLEPSRTSASPPPPATPAVFEYLPLWPFSSQQEADAWLGDADARSESPWHSDAAETALLFTREFLGFNEIDRVIDIDDQGGEAWVDVGSALPNGNDVSVAVIHLARFGTAPDSPWEVVGTRDRARLTLDTPAYGSTLGGPVIEAAGTITGIDECVHLEVRQSTQPETLGEFSCRAAGGDAAPWSAQVTVTGAASGALTLVAWTGGHFARVERFAITGLRG